MKRRGLSGDIFMLESSRLVLVSLFCSVVLLLRKVVMLDSEIDFLLWCGLLINVLIKFLYIFKKKILLMSLECKEMVLIKGDFNGEN